ncbi:MAG TPA: LysR substrate-binding domain-containing protein [Longimicrobiaceae bacterium]|nr:LysR substrate-binding domain-containing protein [Longimicrobiaceae bacterium]
MLDLRALRLFAAVVEHRGFSRAAKASHITQPAVSRAVRQLERKVGVSLLERSARRLRLTEPGEVLYEHARAIFALERAAEEELKARAGVERGRLSIGASTTVATYLLPELLASFARAHPGVDLRVASANTGEIVRRLLGYELEVALVEGPVHDERVEVTPWRSDELVVIAPAKYPLANRGALSPEDLSGETLLVREGGSGTREVGEQALRAAGVQPARTLEIAGTEAIKQAVAAGLGVALVSRAAIADQVALGRLATLPVSGLQTQRTFDLLRLRARRPGPAVLAFEALLTGGPGT